MFNRKKNLNLVPKPEHSRENVNHDSMKKQHFIHTTLSMILINLWDMYIFFDYFLEPKGMFHGLGLFFNFTYSIFFAFILGILIILARILYFKKLKKEKLKNNFFYIFVAIFNFNLLIIAVVSALLNIYSLHLPLLFYLMGNGIISLFIFVDVYYRNIEISKGIV